ncbi:MAG: 3-methyl-2-oxobutanoate hydroxymethyltransferase [Anaerolineae bacterium]|jgi:3-methyl-2-oxobutanoate hydroxymethyltransferase|nr:3-methyl-2-oxobutanoate hydroxymethyltransferase [Anaerolineae bacterium]
MRLTIRDLQKMKRQSERIVMLTAYDATSARLCEQAEVPVLLVGDTLGMVVQGHSSTIPVTLEQMVYHCGLVARATTRPLIVGDLPFMTYSTPEQALRSAARMMQEGGATCVKLEGGTRMAGTIQTLVQAGIPVMAHIGLTPQSVNQVGGFRVQGKDVETARQLLADAAAIQAAGAFAVVLELVPAGLATLITRRLHIPTIGIGAGAGCDGQVQVFHDILGLYDALNPKHTRRYIDAGTLLRSAIAEYRADVLAGRFPTEANSFAMEAAVLALLEGEADDAGH